MAAKKASPSKTTKKTSKASSASQSATVSNGQDRLRVAQVRELVGLMVNNDLTSLEIVDGDLKVSLGRGYSVGQFAQPMAGPLMMHAAPAASATSTAVAAETPKAPVDNLIEIKSPMVGTFYAAPTPDSEPYATIGSRVTEETVICIVEAMKVMNEIKAEYAGTVMAVNAKNGQPVEYGQVLFRVKPD